MDQQFLRQLLDEIREIKRTMITKEDAKSFLTKDDAKNFLTKDDAKNFVTKEYLDKALDKQAEDFGEVVSQLFIKTDEKKADRIEVASLEKRITRIERKFAA